MKTFSPAYAAHVRQPVTTLALCWRVVKRNGDLILATTHDRDIVITSTSIGMDTGSPPFTLAGRYRARAAVTAAEVKLNSDTAVDNTEIDGSVDRTVPYGQIDVSVYDIEAGLLDNAPATLFKVNWNDPNDFQDIIKHGSLGDLIRTAEGAYRVEHRGLAQQLQQVIGQNAGARCNVREFGDARCKKDVDAITVSGIVTSVTNNRRFNSSLTLDSPAPLPGYFNLGKVRWITGANTSYVGQVKDDNVGALGNLLMWEEFPDDIEVGDEFELVPGCDRRYETCRDVHDNLINFRGAGYFCPTRDDIIRSP